MKKIRESKEITEQNLDARHINELNKEFYKFLSKEEETKRNMIYADAVVKNYQEKSYEEVTGKLKRERYQLLNIVKFYHKANPCDCLVCKQIKDMIIDMERSNV